MIRSVLPLVADIGRAEEIESFYRNRGILDRARRFPGCLGTTLWRVRTDPGTAVFPGNAAWSHVVFADWATADDYRAWVTDPWRAEVSAELRSLLAAGSADQIVGVLLEPVDDAA